VALPTDRSWWLEQPSERQTEFLDAPEREVLYGGAAGGGKSIALLMGALEHIATPGYSALILRRQIVDLERDGGLLQVSHAWLGQSGIARWSGGRKRWTFESGATLTFGYLETAADQMRYQSTQYQYIGFDELTEFSEKSYLWMFRSLRRPRYLNVTPRITAATNPIGPGRDWVRKRFVTEPEENRRFIPATMADNPGLQRDEYESNLAQLPQFERQALLHGNWFTDRDTLIRGSWIDAVTTDCLWPTHKPPGGTFPSLYLGVDFGRKRDRTVVWTWEKVGDVCWCREILVMHKTPFAEQMREIRKRLGRWVVKAAMDCGLMGAPLVEELESEFPGVVEAIGLGQPAQRRMAERLRVGFESRKVRVPDDPDLREDLQLVSLGDDGNVVTKRDPAVGHADRFWAAALAYEPACFDEPLTFRAPYVRR